MIFKPIDGYYNYSMREDDLLLYSIQFKIVLRIRNSAFGYKWSFV